MKKTMGNEKGYALLVVLFLVVFIMTVSALFIRGSLSNAKQEQRVDQNHLAVVAAEMGVEYYIALFSNNFKEIGEEIWKEHKQAFLEKVNKDPKINIPTEIYNTEKLIQDDIIRELRGLLLNLSLFTPMSETDKQFSFRPLQDEFGNFEIKICEEDKCEQPGEIFVEGKAIGVYAGNSKTMEFKVTFRIPRLFDGQVPPPENTEIVTEWPCQGNCEATVNDPVKVGDVSLRSGNFLFNDNLVANSLKIQPGGGRGAFNITVAKDFHIKDKLDAHNQACIAVQGNLTVDKEIIIRSNGHIYIYVYGDAYFPSNNSFNNIFVSGDVYISGKKQTNKKFSPVPKGSKCELPEKSESDIEFPELSNWEWMEPDIEVYYN